MKVALHNLGCKVNAYETEAMQEMLEQNGYEMRVLKAVEAVNEDQKSLLFKKASRSPAVIKSPLF